MTVSLGDVKTDAGLNKLNSYLKDRSYIDGYLPTQLDVQLLEAVAKEPTDKFVHAKRWFRHIKSFTADKKSLTTSKKNLKDLGVTASGSAAADNNDDDFELFGSDEEADAEAERAREERLKAYAEKKSKKPQVVAKSNVILDVKPWDDETDMKVMEEKVRTITCDGLMWGVSKLVPLAYGIKKLQIVCVVEDEKVSIDWLTEEIEKFEDVVQSVDIAAFQKI